jgi:hypothetical protein
LPGRALNFSTGVEPIRSKMDRAPFELATGMPVFLEGK